MAPSLLFLWKISYLLGNHAFSGLRLPQRIDLLYVGDVEFMRVMSLL